MGTPTAATKKRLFAVSGNQCAFRNCPQPLVDESTGKVTARICHINGNKPGSKRYDAQQSEEHRQGFDNLILMCPIHHDVIDADDVAYTVDVLRAIKAEHEAKCGSHPSPEDRLIEIFVANVSLETTEGSIILSANQSGGQTAHVIHNNYGTAPEQASTFRRELAARHLADVEDADFGRTVYHKKMGVIRDERFVPLGTTALFFAHAPKPILAASEMAAFLDWANAHKLRYEPCIGHPFIPTLTPDRIGSALVWNNGGMNNATRALLCYTRYLAIERAGFVEYGFMPVSPLENAPPVYYASIIAHLVGFLRFLRDFADQRHVPLPTLSLGVAIRGIKGTGLECITTRLMRHSMITSLPEVDNFLFLRPSEEGSWEVDSVAHSVAEAILDCWEFTRSGWLDIPEFESGAYNGEFFKEKIGYW